MVDFSFIALIKSAARHILISLESSYFIHTMQEQEARSNGIEGCANGGELDVNLEINMLVTSITLIIRVQVH